MVLQDCAEAKLSILASDHHGLLVQGESDLRLLGDLVVRDCLLTRIIFSRTVKPVPYQFVVDILKLHPSALIE